MGLVSRVLDTKALALEEALRVAGGIAEKSPVAVLGTKEVLNFSRDHSVEDGEFCFVCFCFFFFFLLFCFFVFSFYRFFVLSLFRFFRFTFRFLDFLSVFSYRCQ